MKADPAVLRRGAQRIRTGGLAKNALMMDGRYCALGSLGWSPSTSSRLMPELGLLASMLGLDMDEFSLQRDGGYDAAFAAVTQWNDRPERTPPEVISLLEQAAEKAEAEL